MPHLVRGCLILVALSILGSDWPQWRGKNRDNVWQVEKLPETLPEKLDARWKKPIGGGYGGIAVTGGRVYVMDRQKDAEAIIRVRGAAAGLFARLATKEVERVVCLDAETGKQHWVHEYPVAYGRLDYGNGPRCTPTVHAGKVYTLGALGHLYCLDAKSGKVVWSRDTVKDFTGKIPTWGHACSPLVDGKRLIVQVGGKDALLVALDIDSGKEVWRALDDPPGYSSPVIVQTKDWRQLVYFTPRHIVGLDPEKGKVLWKEPFKGITYDVSISDVVYTDGVLLAGNYWSGSKALTLNEKGLEPKVAWEGKALSLLMSTPLVKGKHIYALDRFNGLKCLELRTGKVIWEKEHLTTRGNNPQLSLAWVGGDRALILNTPGELLLVELTPTGLKKLGKAPIIGKTWAHPAFADGCVFARSDEEIVCVPLTGRGIAVLRGWG
jgi:outer membrane protein assembly factor BamB